MTIGFLFWLLMILWLVFGAWSYWPDRRAFGGHFLLWVLLFLLGLEVFGFPIRG